MVKTFNNFLLRNQSADDFEILYATSGAQVLPSFFKWWHWVDLDLFYDKVKFGSLCFCIKGKINGFFRNYSSQWFKTSNRRPKWQEVPVNIKTMSLGGCMPPALGLYTCIKSWKNCINQTSKRFLWNLQQMGKVIRPFCWHQNCPLGVICACPRAIYMY